MIGFELVLDVFMEGSREYDFTLDWALSESKGNSMMEYVHCFYLGGKDGNVKLKLSLGKKTHHTCSLGGKQA